MKNIAARKAAMAKFITVKIDFPETHQTGADDGDEAEFIPEEELGSDSSCVGVDARPKVLFFFLSSVLFCLSERVNVVGCLLEPTRRTKI